MATKKTTAKKTSTKSKRSRSPAKKTNVPAVRHLRYEIENSATPGTETSHYIDLARDISMVNRRMYRQGRDYHVKRITIASSNTIAFGNIDIAVTGTSAQQNAGRVSFSTIDDGWVSQMAWKRGFAVWNKMNREALEQVAGNIAGTWSDFKVSLSREFQTATKLRPMDNGGNDYLLGEWEYSELLSPDGTTDVDAFLLHMLGDHVGAAGARTSVGLIKSYGESRATVQSGSPNVPNEASSDPLVNVFDYGTVIDDVIQDLEFHNDIPPYDIASYPGDDLNAPKPIVKADVCIADGSAQVSGFSVRCGLLEIESRSPIAEDKYSILVELAPGGYRGLKAGVI